MIINPKPIYAREILVRKIVNYKFTAQIKRLYG